MPEGISGPRIAGWQYGFTPGGPVMGPVGPTVVRRGRIQSITMVPQASGATVSGSGSVFGPSTGIERYQVFVEVLVPLLSNMALGVNDVLLTFCDREVPKPLPPVGALINVVLQVKVRR